MNGLVGWAACARRIRIAAFIVFLCVITSGCKDAASKPGSSLYENSEGWYSSATIGPNTIKIGSVARNERDGTVLVENGAGIALKDVAVLNKSALADAAGWLDVVQIELKPGPDRFDIIEARVFDHHTRQSISTDKSPFGWRVVQPNVLQIYGLGKPIPADLDVWFRAQSYAAGDPVTSLAPTVGTSCSLPGGSLTLKNLQPGYWAYEGVKGLTRQLTASEAQISTEMHWSGDWKGGQYQIAAVARDGTKVHTSSPHYLDFGSAKSSDHPYYFDMAIEDIDHFELRPFGGRHTFYFESVKLPIIADKPFGPRPGATIQVGGSEIKQTIQEFAPLRVKIATHRGDWANGVQANEQSASITARDGGATEPEESFTLTVTLAGMGNPSLTFRFQDEAGQPIENQALKKREGTQAFGPSFGAGFDHYISPLDRIHAINVILDPR